MCEVPVGWEGERARELPSGARVAAPLSRAAAWQRAPFAEG